MSQVYRADGEMVPVTKIVAGPCLILQKKTPQTKDGYLAIKCAYQERTNKKSATKPVAGEMKKLGKIFEICKEFRFKNEDQTFEKLNIGDEILPSIFQVGDKVTITGVSKGKGFQGVVKRHHFQGGKATHGNKDQLRMPGSSGATGPKHVFKGKRRPGHMGDEQVTYKGLEIIDIDAANNFIYVKGCLPGARNGLLYIVGKGDFEVKKEPVVVSVEEPKVAEVSSVAPENKAEAVSVDQKPEADNNDKK